MKSTVAIYNSHSTALNAAGILKNKSYPIKQLSIMGRVKIIDNHILIKSNESIKNVEESAGVVLDSTLSVLSGAGVFAVSDFGLIFGAGAIRNTLSDFVLHIAEVGIIPILSKIGIKKGNFVKYREYLNAGKFFLIAEGNEEELETAKNILNNSGKHFELCNN
jgi:hypothetical protein